MLQAGAAPLTVTLCGWRIRPMICFDLRFPVWARNRLDTAGQADYDALIYIANWPERRALAWRTLLRARAIENQCYTIGVNRIGTDGVGVAHIGDSTVIDPLGVICYHQQEIADTQTLILDPATLIEVRATLPFLADGDDFTIHGL
jgi:omega-amidase